ncbi:MAG: MmgE/PrpD family protein [Hyphomicrobiales bacterium]
MSIGITRKLAKMAAWSDLPEAALAVMRLSVFDWVVVAQAGIDEDVSRIVRTMALHEGGKAEASVFGSSLQVPARAAALVNGSTSHALDYDDTHFAHIGHPSVAVVSAAAAIAERVGASGQSFLEAALLGCEASCRIGVWLGRSHYQAGFHQTATAGTFGATIACARLLGLDEEQTCHALGLAATRASGLKSQFGTMGKPYHAGMAASNGVEVAYLASQGFVSRVDGIEASQGFGVTHVGSQNEVDFESQRFLFEDVSHKFHACCHGIHASLEALGEIRRENQFDLHEIENVTLNVHPRWLTVCNIEKPKTGLEAKFSYKVAAAACLAGHDTGALDTYNDALCDDVNLIALRDRVEVRTNEKIGEAAAEVVVRTGVNIFSSSHDLTKPMSFDIRREKIVTKGASLLGESPAANLETNVDNLAQSNAAFTLKSLIG